MWQTPRAKKESGVYHHDFHEVLAYDFPFVEEGGDEVNDDGYSEEVEEYDEDVEFISGCCYGKFFYTEGETR